MAIIRVLRERMVESGIASSLVREVGHQGAASLDLVSSLRPPLRGLQRTNGKCRLALVGDAGSWRSLLITGQSSDWGVRPHWDQ